MAQYLALQHQCVRQTHQPAVCCARRLARPPRRSVPVAELFFVPKYREILWIRPYREYQLVCTDKSEMLRRVTSSQAAEIDLPGTAKIRASLFNIPGLLVSEDTLQNYPVQVGFAIPPGLLVLAQMGIGRIMDAMASEAPRLQVFFVLCSSVRLVDSTMLTRALVRVQGFSWCTPYGFQPVRFVLILILLGLPRIFVVYSL